MKEQELVSRKLEVVRLYERFRLFDPRRVKNTRWFYRSSVILQADRALINFDISAILNFTNRGNCIDVLSGEIVRGYLDPRLVFYGNVPEGVDPEVINKIRIQITAGDLKYISSSPNFYREEEKTLTLGQFEAEFPVKGDKDDYHESHHGLILPQTAYEAREIKAKFLIVD